VLKVVDKANMYAVSTSVGITVNHSR